MASNVTFSAAEKKQIALRFKTLYDIITGKTWTTGGMGTLKTKDDWAVYDEDQLRSMGKKGTKAAKGQVPKGLSMCLVGAAAYVNGPTEEELLALMATQIIYDSAFDAAKGDLADEGIVGGDYPDAIALLRIFDHFVNGGVLCGNAAAGTCIEFNDTQRSVKPIKAMIKRAQKLYDKLETVWQAEMQYEAALRKIKL